MTHYQTLLLQPSDKRIHRYANTQQYRLWKGRLEDTYSETDEEKEDDGEDEDKDIEASLP